MLDFAYLKSELPCLQPFIQESLEYSFRYSTAGPPVPILVSVLKMSSQSAPSMSCYTEGFGSRATCRSLLFSKSVLLKKMCEVTPKKDE